MIGVPRVGHNEADDGPSLPDHERQYSNLRRLLSDRIPNPKRVWSKNFKRANKRLRSFKSTRTLFLFHHTNPLRRLLLLIAENKLFDKFILICICINCVFLAVDDDPPPNSTKGRLLAISELIFNILYSIEMVIKIIAWGFYWAGPHSYLRSWWNVLDAVVVCGGWINQAFAGAGGISALRVFRLLKPLKAISSVPGMKVQVKALLSSIPSLLNVGALLCFLFFVFGILGMQLLGGKLRFRCVDDITGEIAENTSKQIYGLCNPERGGKGVQCAAGTTCLDTKENPNSNVTGFDNIAMAWLTILQCISLEGWVDVMYMVKETSGVTYDMYFVILILVGAYFVMNLVVAIIFIRFKGFKELEEERMLQKAINDSRNSIDSKAAHPNTKRRFSSLLSKNSILQDEDSSDESADAPDLQRNARNDGNSNIHKRPSKVNLPLMEEKNKSLEELTKENTMINSSRESLLDSSPQRTSPQRASLLDKEGIDSEEKYRPKSDEETPSSPQRDESSNVSYPTLRQLASHDEAHHSCDSTEHGVIIDGDTIQHQSSRRKSLLLTLHQQKIKPFAMTIIHDSRFDWFIIACIVLNSIFLAVQKFEMSDFRAAVLNVSNLVFTIIFLIEMILKISGMGFANYLADSWNRFDGIIVIISMVDIGAGEDSNSSLTALRTFRLMRVFKLLKFLHGLRELLETVMSTLTDLKYFFTILCLFVFIYALIGIQLFRGEMRGLDGEVSRANFDNFLWACITVFQILTGENWNEVLYDGVRDSKLAAFYFISCFVVGNYIVLSLFMAILLGNFEAIPADEEDEERSAKWRLVIKEKFKAFLLKMVSPISGCGSFLKKHLFSNRVRPSPRLDEEEGKIPSLMSVDSFFIIDQDTTTLKDENATRIPQEETALCCLDRNNILRKFAIVVVGSPWFDRFVMALILVSSVLLALDTPTLDADSNLAHFLYIADIVVTVLFTIEMVFKIAALGFVVHEGSYLRSGWNRIDGFIVIVSIMNLFMSGLAFIKGIRALRALRPLRMISRFENMKLVINSIFATAPALANVLLICILFFYIFGIIGVQQFNGLYWHCVDTTTVEVNVLPFDKVDCIANDDMDWRPNHLGTFDDIGESMMLLFELASLEQWPVIMYAAIDAQGPGLQPKTNYSPSRFIFFVVFLLLCSFFVLSLFVGVVVDEYHKYHEQYTIGCITESQKEWLDTVRRMLSMNTKKVLIQPTQPIRKALFRLVTDDKFELLITIVIGLNVLVMSMSTYDQSKDWEDTLDFLNLIFTYIFIGEMAFKWVGLGILQYFKDNWNKFDFVIVLCSIIVLVLESMGSADELGFDPTIARVLRITRIFRIIKRAKSIRQLLSTLLYSLPALYNVSALVLLLMFIYAVAGMSLFGDVMYGEYLNEHANFRGFYVSLMTLWRMMSGESWNGIYRDCSIDESNSNCSQSEGNCGSFVWAFLYFYSFIIISAMVLLNVFVAVVLKNFEEQIAAANKELTVPMDAMHEFEKLWLKFCEPDGEFMRISRLSAFLNLLVKPLGLLKAPKFGNDLERFIFELKIPQANGLIHYIDLGTSLTLNVFGRNTSHIPKKNEFGKFLQNEMFRKFPKFKSFKKLQTDTWSVINTMQHDEIAADRPNDDNDDDDGTSDSSTMSDGDAEERKMEEQHSKMMAKKEEEMEMMERDHPVIATKGEGDNDDGDDKKALNRPPMEKMNSDVEKKSVFEYRRDHLLSERQRVEVLHFGETEIAIHDELESENLKFGSDDVVENVEKSLLGNQEKDDETSSISSER